MSLTNPNKVVTEERLSEFYTSILPYLGGMPEAICNKFDKANLYSTDEKLIGRWIDGKPLYQKTFESTLPSAVTTGTEVFKYVATGISIDRPISIIATFKKESGNAFSGSMFFGYANGTLSNGYRVFVGHNASPSPYTNAISIANSNTAWNEEAIYITIQYTKTTDAANSFNYGSETDYSTTEKIVGTWIDGKPVYQKTLTGTLVNASSIDVPSYTRLQIGASISRGWLISGFVENETGVMQALSSFYKSDNKSLRYYVAANNSGSDKENSVMIENCWFTSGSKTVYATVQYIKTT